MTCEKMPQGSSNQPTEDMHHVSIGEHDGQNTQNQPEFAHEAQYNAAYDTSDAVFNECESVSEELLLPKEEVIDPLEEESEEYSDSRKEVSHCQIQEPFGPETQLTTSHTEEAEYENQKQELARLQQELHECARRHGRKRADILTAPRK